ncbi:MAG: hypothetical protein RLZZ628_3811 [Bacteroidota bacterium]|jgi:hypothetical protein
MFSKREELKYLFFIKIYFNKKHFSIGQKITIRIETRRTRILRICTDFFLSFRRKPTEGQEKIRANL